MRRVALCVAFLAIAGTAHAAGDAKHGEALFNRCAQCHNAVKDGGNGLGPNLFGVAGRKAASVQGFYYSAALKASKLVWSDYNLKKWVMAPSKLVPGTSMYFAGFSKPQDAEDLVAWLKSRK